MVPHRCTPRYQQEVPFEQIFAEGYMGYSGTSQKGINLCNCKDISRVKLGMLETVKLTNSRVLAIVRNSRRGEREAAVLRFALVEARVKRASRRRESKKIGYTLCCCLGHSFYHFQCVEESLCNNPANVRKVLHESRLALMMSTLRRSSASLVNWARYHRERVL